MNRILLATLCATGLTTVAFGQAPADRDALRLAQASTKPASAMSDGEVRKVDKDAGKITIRHGPLANLDMPAMTMVFRVKDPGMLSQVKEGDKIKFVADKINGAFTVVQIEVVR
jgi:Cu(I)/Ag(I) efflux system periplasmic protein CusF